MIISEKFEYDIPEGMDLDDIWTIHDSIDFLENSTCPPWKDEYYYPEKIYRKLYKIEDDNN